MQKKIISFMEKYHMVEEGECILAAVSGGADSICLLLILLALQQTKHYQLCVVHVEHGIRGEDSMQDALFVEHFCKNHQIACKIFHCHAIEYAREYKMTVEEGARALRYKYFYQAAALFQADKIAVAHNQNDCAETILFHLARGTGLKGMCGIPPVRDKIIRPLLCVRRKEIEAYLAERKQKFCQDKTNETLDYTRNKIRHQILPVLEEINEQAVAHINQIAFSATEAEELVEHLAEDAKKKYVSQDKLGFHIFKEILEEKPILQKAILHKVLVEIAKKNQDISKIHVQQMQELFEKQTGKKLYLPYDIKAERTYNGILLNKIKDIACEEQQVWTLPLEGILKIPSYGYEIHTKILKKIPENKEIPKKMYTKWMDYDRIKGNMHLRTRQEQDYFVISPDGRQKKLKRYFIDEKVPRQQRGQVLLLAEGAHVLWAIGGRISEDVKVTKETQRVLEIQVYGGNVHE